ncbi:MAG TPA: cytochrome c [Pseudomonadales bacterium]
MHRLWFLLWLACAPAAAEDPKVAYWLHCAGCHRLDGSGAPPEVPTLIGEPGRIAMLPGGREYLVRVPGVAQANIDDGQLAQVLNYMLETFSAESLPAGYPRFVPEEVGRLREAVLKDPLKRRAEILGSKRSDGRQSQS